MKLKNSSLHDHADIVMGQSPPSQFYNDIGNGLPFIQGRTEFTDMFPIFKKYTSKITRIALPDDILFTVRAPVGDININDRKCCIGRGIAAIRPNEQTRFLFYNIKFNKSRFIANSGEGVYDSINKDALSNTQILVPASESTRNKIASILSAYDDLIENNLKRIKLLEEAARNIYKEWFVNFRFPNYENAKIVNGLPDGWEKSTLGEIAPLIYGKGLKASERKEGMFPVYGSSGIVGFHNQSLVSGPGIVVGRKGNVGSIYWVNKDFYPIDTVYFIDPKSVSIFIYYSLMELNFISSDAAVPGLNRKYAHSLKINIPTDVLLSKFIENVTPVFNMIETINQQNQKLKQARDILLPRLMSGEVEV